MKVIDLLNKIANGEVPKKIKFRNYIFIAKGNGLEGFVDYACNDVDYCFSHYLDVRSLNDEVEIIEEDKKIEKLYHCCMSTDNKEIEFLIKYINNLSNKINEIIYKLNKE